MNFIQRLNKIEREILAKESEGKSLNYVILCRLDDDGNQEYQISGENWVSEKVFREYLKNSYPEDNGSPMIFIPNEKVPQVLN